MNPACRPKRIRKPVPPTQYSGKVLMLISIRFRKIAVLSRGGGLNVPRLRKRPLLYVHSRSLGGTSVGAMRQSVGQRMPRVIAQLQRAVIVIGLLLATAYASVGFVLSGANRPPSDERGRTSASMTSTMRGRNSGPLSAAIAALNDPARYGQYANARRAPHVDDDAPG